MSIRTKLLLGFGTTVLLLIILLGVVQIRVADANSATEKVVNQATPAVELSLNLEGSIHHALSMHRGYMILGLDELAQERLAAWDRIDLYTEQLDELAAAWDSPELVKKYEQFKLRMAEFRVAQQEIAEVAHTNADMPANQQYFDVADPFAKEMMSHLGHILNAEEHQPATLERKLLVRYVSAAEGHLLKSQSAIAAYLVSGSEAHLSHVHSNLSACQKSVDRLYTQLDLFTPEQLAHFEKYISARTKFISEANSAIQTRSEPGFCVSENICLNTVTPLASEALGLLGEIGDAQVGARNSAIESYESAKSSLVTMVWIIGTLAILMATAISMYLSESITRRIKSVMDYSTQIAERDLSMPDLQMKAKDEIGRLAQTVSHMKNALKEVITEVARSTSTVASASGEIAASAEQMAAGLKEQEQQTQQVAAAIEELSQSVGEVATKSSEATRASEESQHQAEEGGIVVRDTVHEMEGIASEVSVSAQTVNSLGEQSQKIGEIIEVINDIADQTNLLALNAAIEAARAGEHGRGFAVVADEVRKLAERTTQATEEVSRSIQGIQGETGSAVEQIQSSSMRVGRGVDLASQAGRSLETIVTGSKSVQQMVQDIAAAANQQATASDDIARSIENISTVTRQSSEGAGQASQAAADLAHQSEHLMGLVGKFKT